MRQCLFSHARCCKQLDMQNPDMMCSFACSRRHRIRSLPGHFGYRLMAGGEDGMSPAELRALPVVIHEKPLRPSRQQEGEWSFCLPKVSLKRIQLATTLKSVHARLLNGKKMPSDVAPTLPEELTLLRSKKVQKRCNVLGLSARLERLSLPCRLAREW